ncbi:MAG: TRAP transporter permease DctQ [Blastopirellula sp.]|nr:MAG: TRAP transporter permease DctQ [Blastopirellula sp.]
MIQLFTRLCRVFAGLAFAIMIMAVLTQVIARTCSSSDIWMNWFSFACFSAPVWTEELTRYALLYLTAFGVGLSFQSGDLVNVDVICESLPGKAPWVLRLISAILGFLVCAILVLPAWKFVSIGKIQTSPALSVRMDFVHASVFVLLLSLAIFLLARVIGMLAGHDDGLPNREWDDI